MSALIFNIARVAKAAIIIWFLFLLGIFFLGIWYRRKLCEYGQKELWEYRDCRWYHSPKSFGDKLACRLAASRLFIRLLDESAIVCIPILFFAAIFFLLFLIAR